MTDHTAAGIAAGLRAEIATLVAARIAAGSAGQPNVYVDAHEIAGTSLSFAHCPVTIGGRRVLLVDLGEVALQVAALGSAA